MSTESPPEQTYKLSDKTFIIHTGDVVVLSQGEYSDYRVIGVLVRTPQSRPLNDLMAAFKTGWKMQPEDERRYGWSYSGPWSMEGFVRMCVAGGWLAPRIHEFFLENYGGPDGAFTEFSATTYGDGTHPNQPEVR